MKLYVLNKHKYKELMNYADRALHGSHLLAYDSVYCHALYLHVLVK
jgi:hypothetical protein